MRSYRTFVTRNIGIFAVAALAAAGCNTDRDVATMPSAQDMATINIKSDRAQPERIVIDPNGPQRLYLTSEEGRYTFVVEDLGINVDIPQGDTVTVDLSGRPAGEYRFYALLPGTATSGSMDSGRIEGSIVLGTVGTMMGGAGRDTSARMPGDTTGMASRRDTTGGMWGSTGGTWGSTGGTSGGTGGAWGSGGTTMGSARAGMEGDTVSIVADEDELRPNRVVIESDDPRALQVTTTEESVTFAIEDLNIEVNVPVGDTVTVDLRNAPEGTYTFHSTTPGQREQGLEGTLVIEGMNGSNTNDMNNNDMNSDTTGTRRRGMPGTGQNDEGGYGY